MGMCLGIAIFRNKNKILYGNCQTKPTVIYPVNTKTRDSIEAANEIIDIIHCYNSNNSNNTSQDYQLNSSTLCSVSSISTISMVCENNNTHINEEVYKNIMKNYDDLDEMDYKTEELMSVYGTPRSHISVLSEELY